MHSFEVVKYHAAQESAWKGHIKLTILPSHSETTQSLVILFECISTEIYKLKRFNALNTIFKSHFSVVGIFIIAKYNYGFLASIIYWANTLPQTYASGKVAQRVISILPSNYTWSVYRGPRPLLYWIWTFWRGEDRKKSWKRDTKMDLTE